MCAWKIRNRFEKEWRIQTNKKHYTSIHLHPSVCLYLLVYLWVTKSPDWMSPYNIMNNMYISGLPSDTTCGWSSLTGGSHYTPINSMHFGSQKTIVSEWSVFFIALVAFRVDPKCLAWFITPTQTLPHIYHILQKCTWFCPVLLCCENTCIFHSIPLIELTRTLLLPHWHWGDQKMFSQLEKKS